MRLTICLGLVLLTACSDDPTPGADTAGGDTTPDTTADTQGDTQAPPIASVIVRAAEGATIRAGQATLVIPPNALAQDTAIEVQYTGDAPENPPSQWILGSPVTLLPHGLTFSTPATLSFPYDTRHTAPRKRLLRRSDTTSTDWAEVSGATFIEGVVTASIDSFSQYLPINDGMPEGSIGFFIRESIPCEELSVTCSCSSRPMEIRATLPANGTAACLTSPTSTFVGPSYGTHSWTAKCDDTEWSGEVELGSQCVLVELIVP